MKAQAKMSKKSKNNITKSATVFIFAKAEDGEPLYISDVKAWLTEVEKLNLPDSTEIEGSLYLCLDLENPSAETIYCGECDYQDILLATHPPH
jgi:hypothetical protein